MPRNLSDMSATRVAAVISAFNPGPELVLACRALLDQVASVTVVDDGSTADISALLNECAALGCTVIGLDQNMGIAAALNTGAEAALGDVPSPEFVLTLDQDSTLQPDYVARALSAYSSATAAGIRVGLVAPHTVEGLPSRVARERNGVLFGLEPIQSGLVIPRSVWEAVGPFRADLFIDSVDTEYFMRVSDAGFETVLAPATHLSHSLGRRVYPTIFGRRIRLPGVEVGFVVSSPFRYYYIARNLVLMNRAFGRRHRRWSVRQTALTLRHFVIAVLVSPQRRMVAHYIAVGWRDGIRGRRGRMPEALS